jgi:hypothetical protein
MSTDLNAPAKWGHFVGPGYEMKREMAKPLILTSCNLNTTRPSTNPTTLAIGSTAGGSITFPSTVLANQTAVQIAMNSRLKTVPLLFRVYAIPSGLSQSDSYLEPVCPMAMKLFDAV